MLGVSHTIEDGEKGNQENNMNKLSDDNAPVFIDTAMSAHPDDRLVRLNDGDLCETLGEEDDADQKSLSLESLKEKSKMGLLYGSIRDRDFVSESSLTIVSDNGIYENSRWWSMMLNNSNSTSNIINPNLNSSVNNIDAHTIPISSTTTASSTSNTTNNNNINSNVSNSRTNAPTRRRSSLLSEITFPSEDYDDTDAHTTDSNDSSWANNSAMLGNSSGGLLAIPKRSAPNLFSVGKSGSSNEVIEEEYQDYLEQLKNDRDSTVKTTAAVNGAPVIPRRRVSVKPGSNRAGTNYNPGVRAATTNTIPSDIDTRPAATTYFNHIVALRAIPRDKAAAPTIPKRTSSHSSKHSSKLPSVKKNTMIYQMYNASFGSIVDSQYSVETESSFFEDGSAAAAAAAYLSSAALTSQQDDVRTVHTTPTSQSSDTPVFTNQCEGRKLSREEGSIDSETPPILPERRDFSTFQEEIDFIPSIALEEEPQDNDSVPHSTNIKTKHQPPTIPMRKNSGSMKKYAVTPRVVMNRELGQHLAPRINTQAPTCPMRKNSHHNIRRCTSAAAVISSPCRSKFLSHEMSLPMHQKPQRQSSLRHRPPTKPMRTSSHTNSRNCTATASSS